MKTLLNLFRKKQDPTQDENYNPCVYEYRNNSNVEVLSECPSDISIYKSVEYCTEPATGFYGWVCTKKELQ